MRHVSSIGRWTVVGLVGITVIVPLVILASLSPLPRSASAADLKSAAGHHGPAYGLTVVPDTVAFHATTRTPAAPPPPMNAAAGILVDIDTGEILWQENPHKALPPASTTKVMTALVVLENFSPGQLVTITPDALNQQWDETRMGLKAGEQLTVRELLTGMLLVSANDAATSLATDTVGYQRFVDAMNAQETALGLSDSHFATPVGLDTPGHDISAYDEAAIASVAVKKFPLFQEIIRMPGAELPTTPTHQAYSLGNINALLGLYPPAVGIKPGYTGDAGYCLVGMAVRDGHRLISVVMNAPLDVHQSRALLDWGFTVEGLPALLPPATPAPTPRH